MLENRPDRLTLRSEYFGGLVYDAKNAKVELLQPVEHDLLTRLALAEEDVFRSQVEADPVLGQRLDVLKKIGLIDVHEDGRLTLTSVRIIPPLSPMPDGVLTAPIRVFDSITQFCNFECPQCYFSSSNQVTEQRRSVDQTVDIMGKFAEVGSMEWRITGGEPTTNPDLFDMISAGKNLGMNVGLYTNGWWSDNTSQRILDSGLDEIVISVEGKPEVNDRRRRPGSFGKAIQSLAQIQEFNIGNSDHKINGIIAAAVGRDNVDDIEFLVRLAIEYGVDINFMPLKPSGRARSTMNDLYFTPLEYMRFARRVEDARQMPEVKDSDTKIILKYKDLFSGDYPDKSKLPYPFNYSECGALTTAISILPDGRVYSCPFVLDVDPDGAYMGPNMIDVSAYEAWLNPSFQKYRAATKEECVDCEFYMKQCRGACRATVLGNGGSIIDGRLVGSDPQCFASLLEK